MTKYLKVTVSGPYVNTDQTTYIELYDDDFNEDGKLNRKVEDEHIEDCINNYVESSADVVDEADVPPEDLP